MIECISRKEDYADFTDPENWDIISNNVALIRGDIRGLYNPLLEAQNIYQVELLGLMREDYGSPIGTIWRYGPNYGDAGETAVNPIVPYGPWNTWGSYWYGNPPFLIGMYSTEDNAYYDFYVTNWTSGNGPGWQGTGDGNGEGNGEDLHITDLVLLMLNLLLLALLMFQTIKVEEF